MTGQVNGRIERQEEGAPGAYSRSDDNTARAIAYLGPYVFWVTLGILSSAIFLIA